MLIDGLNLVEGSYITNPTVASGTVYPSLGNIGELFYRTDSNTLFVYDGADWGAVSADTFVISINSLSGAVTLTKSDIGLSNVDNTSDINKPVSTAQAADATSKANAAQAASTPIAHASDTALHLTSGQNTLLDSLTATATELNYVDGVTSAIQDQIDDKVALAGSTMTGNLVMTTGTKITIPDAPIAGTDAANKNYVDSASAGLSWKNAVNLATTADITLSGTQTIDGVSAIVGNRVLVKNQTAAENNGIYVVAAGTWSRSTDMDQTTPVNEINSAAVFVLDGLTNGGSGWTQTNDVTTLGTDSVIFTQFNGASVINAGVGLLKTGNQLDINLGAGISQLPSDEVGIDIYTGGGLMTTVDGSSLSTATAAQLSLTQVGTAGTYKSVTVNAHGRVIGGSNPTTLAGYGITDAVGSLTCSGVGISVDQANGPVTLTSNATALNNVNTIVARDGSGNFAANIITATATSAQYADVAEKYTSDANYEPGTVVSFGGDAEVTISSVDGDRAVAGVVSHWPAYLMNADLEGVTVTVALLGRVPVKVKGIIYKGDMIISAGNGYARSSKAPIMGQVIGKALENFNGVEGIIEVVVGRL